MTRPLTLGAACAALLLPLVAACSPSAADDDDSTPPGDDDDATDDDDAAPPTEVAEQEPNDTHPFQDLGTLAAGASWEVTGVATTAGHDDTDNENPDGDLDVFALQVESGGDVRFTLSFESGQDFDMVVYGDVTADTLLGFGSDDALGFDAASQEAPEQTRHALVPGTAYAVMVANWEGDEGAAYTLTIETE